MKILAFPDVKTYEMFYEGLLTGTTKGAETRVLAKIQVKLEEQGTPILDKGVPTILYTAAQAVIVELEDAEFELAKRITNTVDWNNLVVKSAAKLIEFLEKVPTKEEYEATKVGVLKLETGT